MTGGEQTLTLKASGRANTAAFSTGRRASHKKNASINTIETTNETTTAGPAHPCTGPVVTAKMKRAKAANRERSQVNAPK